MTKIIFMLTLEKENWVVEGSEERKMPVEGIFSPKLKAPTVIFVHGYKGYKDWGAWNHMVPHFHAAGINLVKFNFSHNGGTVKNPVDFPDLEAFSKNTYSKELYDLNKVVENVRKRLKAEKRWDQVYLVGHSRGGADVILHAARDHNIKKMVTWAAVSNIFERFPSGEALEHWKKEGVRFEKNKRTKQDMPVRIDIYNDAYHNQSKLDVMSAASVIDIPWLIVHGEEDEAVDVNAAIQLKGQTITAEMKIYEGTGHTFGTKHPYEETALQYPFDDVVRATIEFLKR